MKAIVTFFMWLFGWTSPTTPPETPTLTPTVRQSQVMVEGYTPERHNQGKNQTVTIIIYDDTHFKFKK